MSELPAAKDLAVRAELNRLAEQAVHWQEMEDLREQQRELRERRRQ